MATMKKQNQISDTFKFSPERLGRLHEIYEGHLYAYFHVRIFCKYNLLPDLGRRFFVRKIKGYRQHREEERNGES